MNEQQLWRIGCHQCREHLRIDETVIALMWIVDKRVAANISTVQWKDRKIIEGLMELEHWEEQKSNMFKYLSADSILWKWFGFLHVCNVWGFFYYYTRVTFKLWQPNEPCCTQSDKRGPSAPSEGRAAGWRETIQQFSEKTWGSSDDSGCHCR